MWDKKSGCGSGLIQSGYGSGSRNLAQSGSGYGSTMKLNPIQSGSGYKSITVLKKTNLFKD
jgi:hypothetical protein